MYITLFFCETAVTGPDGKLSVQGIFNELYSSGFPATQDRLILAGTIEWDRDTDGQQNFRVDIVAPDDKSIFTIDAASDVDARDASRPPAISHLIFPLKNLVFTEAGRYRVQLHLEKQKIAGPSLHVLCRSRPARGC